MTLAQIFPVQCVVDVGNGPITSDPDVRRVNYGPLSYAKLCDLCDQRQKTQDHLGLLNTTILAQQTVKAKAVKRCADDLWMFSFGKYADSHIVHV